MITETKEDKAIREIVCKLWEEYEFNPKNCDDEGNALYWIGESGFLEIATKAARAAYNRGVEDSK